MKPADQPIIAFLGATFRLADENEHHVHEVLDLAERFKAAGPDNMSKRRRLRSMARHHIRRLHANAERFTRHLARFERHILNAPLYWHSTLRDNIKMGTRETVLAHRAAFVMRNLFEPPARLAAGAPRALVH